MSLNSEKKFSIVFLSFFSLIFILILVKVGIIIFTHNNGAKQYNNPQVADTVIRGSILDRNNNYLAVEIPAYDLVFFKNYIPSLEYAASLVSPYTGLSKDELLQKCEKANNYVMVKRNVSLGAVTDLNEEIKVNKLQKGIVLEKRQGRTYPSTFHASQIIGFTNTENKGLEGIEYKYDDILTPYPEVNTSTTYGANIALTLDLDIQYLMDVQVQNIIKDEDPDCVMALVMDAKTGDILASTSAPWYDLNNYSTSTEGERFNRVSGYSYEPGSVFKVFSLASCIENGIDTETPFICDGSETFTVDGQSFTINCHEKHGEVTGKEMISKSCNGAIAYWVLQLDKQVFYDFLSSLGFGQVVNSGMNGNIKGTLKEVDTWSNRSQATISFGQEVAVSALQIVQAASAIANDGVMVKPEILKGIYTHDGKLVYAPERETKEVMSKETAQKLREYMVEATKAGTAVLANVPGVEICSKTGTSQIINPETNSYDDGYTLASTLTIVPAKEPKYIIYFAVVHPKVNVWGANIASPAIGAIINGLIGQGKIESEIQKSISL